METRQENGKPYPTRSYCVVYIECDHAPENDDAPWYISVPVGVNTLQAMVPKMSEEAGTSVRYTNHSLRATSANRLFACNILEKIIKEKTGHRNLAGLRSYEKTTCEQEHFAMKVLNAERSEERVGECDKVCKVEGASDAKDQVEKCLGCSTVISGQMQGCVFNF